MVPPLSAVPVGPPPSRRSQAKAANRSVVSPSVIKVRFIFTSQISDVESTWRGARKGEVHGGCTRPRWRRATPQAPGGARRRSDFGIIAASRMRSLAPAERLLSSLRRALYSFVVRCRVQSANFLPPNRRPGAAPPRGRGHASERLRRRPQGGGRVRPRRGGSRRRPARLRQRERRLQGRRGRAPLRPQG